MVDDCRGCWTEPAPRNTGVPPRISGSLWTGATLIVVGPLLKPGCERRELQVRCTAGLCRLSDIGGRVQGLGRYISAIRPADRGTRDKESAKVVEVT